MYGGRREGSRLRKKKSRVFRLGYHHRHKRCLGLTGDVCILAYTCHTHNSTIDHICQAFLPKIFIFSRNLPPPSAQEGRGGAVQYRKAFPDIPRTAPSDLPTAPEAIAMSARRAFCGSRKLPRKAAGATERTEQGSRGRRTARAAKNRSPFSRKSEWDFRELLLDL